jgi:alpha-N-arabinofuranosidase
MRTISIMLLTLVSACSYSQTMELAIDTNSKAIISRHIYGHFSEHLGRCIYDGFWVNENSQVPKKDRIRLDIVEALKK